MRRVSAIWLLGVFSFALIAPLLPAADADSNLPACCRRNGRHHCMMTPDSPAAGVSISAVCPAYPRTGAAPAHSNVTGMQPAHSVSVPVVALAVQRARSRSLAHLCVDGTPQKRGPPTILS